jgi:hypothetical protein
MPFLTGARGCPPLLDPCLAECSPTSGGGGSRERAAATDLVPLQRRWISHPYDGGELAHAMSDDKARSRHAFPSRVWGRSSEDGECCRHAFPEQAWTVVVLPRQVVPAAAPSREAAAAVAGECGAGGGHEYTGGRGVRWGRGGAGG